MASYPNRCIRALVLSTLVGATCSQGNGASLSFERSQALLELLDNFGKAGLPNTEELAFHLCDLALPLTQAAQHKAQLGSYLEGIEPMRLSGQKLAEQPAAAQNGLRTARQLYRIAAAEILANYLNQDWGGTDFTFLPQDQLTAVFAQLDLQTPGYQVQWQLLVGGRWLILSAVPVTYPDSGKLSMELNLDNGIASLRGGDLGGKPLDAEKGSMPLVFLTWPDL